ncbi:hypothetical protein GCM10022215_31360 [Nocardioides fonticola]|uniref:Methyl-accepting chemotaxis protein n=1 Tax=Nocardioides fonticola TaxID=450363 RepID=A0ABP7XQW7_9ACTN
MSVHLLAASAAALDTEDFAHAYDQLPTPVMIADTDLVIRYLNAASQRALQRVEAHLPVPATAVLGSSLDVFHRHPQHQRRILADTSALPRRALIDVGPEVLELTVTTVRDRAGVVVGSMAVWDVVTDRVRQDEERIAGERDAAAANRVEVGVAAAVDADAAVLTAIERVREEFGWAYGSFWRIEDDGRLHCAAESGTVSPEFAQLTRTASFAEGEGLAGRAWAARDLVHTADLGAMTDCVRAPVAHRLGIRSGVCLPITHGGVVIGTMDFLTTETVHLSERRLDVLRTVGRLVSNGIERLAREEEDRRRGMQIAMRVQQILAAVERAAEGDLSQDLELAGEEDPATAIAVAFNAMLAQQRSALGRLAETTTGLGEAGAHLGGLAGSMAADAGLTDERARSASTSAAEVSAAVSSVAAAAEEMTASIREIAHSATEAAAVAATAVEAATGARTTVASLGESSTEIGEVLKLITSIARQTNLLALNATIEAARAGDAGKGFAVVAGEVKELAKETARATEDIGRRVEAIQGDSAEAATSIARIAEVIGRISDLQTSIASAVEQQTATTNEIARSVSEAAEGAEQIARDVTDVVGAAASTLEGTRRTRDALGDMAQMGTTLEELVGAFRF